MNRLLTAALVQPAVGAVEWHGLTTNSFGKRSESLWVLPNHTRTVQGAEIYVVVAPDDEPAGNADPALLPCASFPAASGHAPRDANCLVVGHAPL
jgi:hypothetical protein